MSVFEEKPQTKIVCTIGPGSSDIGILKEMLEAGMNTARLNFSHGTHAEHKARLDLIRRASAESGIPVAILLDMKGPEVRTGIIENDGFEIRTGETLILTSEDRIGTPDGVSYSYKNLAREIRPGMRIFIDDGIIELRVREIVLSSGAFSENASSFDRIICDVVTGGPVETKKGINVPDADLSIPGLSATDLADIDFGIREQVDFIAVSFVRCAQDIVNVRNILKAAGSPIHLIAKIENRQGIQNAKEIISVSDGLMVARGDLGVEIPVEEVPARQKDLIRLCNRYGKPVITATQMLDSMTRNPRPTRAEAGDVANAVFDGTDAVMLSGETAKGKYPVESVRMMAKIAKRAEQYDPWREANVNYIRCPHAENLNYIKEHIGDREKEKIILPYAIAKSACTLAENICAKAILVSTGSGFTAAKVASFRPDVPIIAGTPDDGSFRRMLLIRGVVPITTGSTSSTDEMLGSIIARSRDAGYVSDGDRVVLVAGIPAGKKTTNLIKVHVIGEDLY